MWDNISGLVRNIKMLITAKLNIIGLLYVRSHYSSCIISRQEKLEHSLLHWKLEMIFQVNNRLTLSSLPISSDLKSVNLTNANQA